jgi:hypothetical protein
MNEYIKLQYKTKLDIVAKGNMSYVYYVIQHSNQMQLKMLECGEQESGWHK